MKKVIRYPIPFSEVIPGTDFVLESAALKKLEEPIKDDSPNGFHNQYGGPYNAAGVDNGLIRDIGPDEVVNARSRSIKSEYKRKELGLLSDSFED